MLKSDANSAAMGLQLLNSGKAHDGCTDVLETLGREVRARDVLDEGSEVDARVLLRVAVGCYLKMF